MKNIIRCTLLAVCLPMALPCAKAQESGKAVSIENVRTQITGETLAINFDVKASRLDIGCDDRLTLEFAVESPDRRLVLPAVVYSGKQRYRYEQRRNLLSDGYTTEPYHIYKGVGKDKTCELAYVLTVPYSPWMEHAAVTCRKYVHGCGGERLAESCMLTADLNPASPAPAESEVWKPNPALFPDLVSFLVPEVEEVKTRASMIELRIGYPVNVTGVHPDFGNNRYELARADSLVGMLQSNDLIDIRGVSICGYASPEGSYTVNERLARGRSEGFRNYLVGKYPANEFIRTAHTSWVAEDWDGVGRLVAQNDHITQKTEVLAIVNDGTIAPDTKDRMLQKIVWWSSNYKIILKEMYPKLRRIEPKVDYTVQNLTDAQARKLLYTNPDMLSLDEIYRMARYYEPGSRQYRDVYEIAARQYPNDVIANNNAAAALLQEGKAEAALPYLKKIEGRNESLINFGAYWYIMEDLDKSAEYFDRAKEAGNERAVQNLRLINPAR